MNIEAYLQTMCDNCRYKIIQCNQDRCCSILDVVKLKVNIIHNAFCNKNQCLLKTTCIKLCPQAEKFYESYRYSEFFKDLYKEEFTEELNNGS